MIWSNTHNPFSFHFPLLLSVLPFSYTLIATVRTKGHCKFDSVWLLATLSPESSLISLREYHQDCVFPYSVYSSPQNSFLFCKQNSYKWTVFSKVGVLVLFLLLMRSFIPNMEVLFRHKACLLGKIQAACQHMMNLMNALQGEPLRLTYPQNKFYSIMYGR